MIRVEVVFECDECSTVKRELRPVEQLTEGGVLPKGWKRMGIPDSWPLLQKDFCGECIGIGHADGFREDFMSLVPTDLKLHNPRHSRA